MAFSEETRKQALINAGYKCEKCKTPVTTSTSEAHHKTSVTAGGGDNLSNCQILCIPCHKDTHTYGKH